MEHFSIFVSYAASIRANGQLTKCLLLINLALNFPSTTSCPEKFCKVWSKVLEILRDCGICFDQTHVRCKRLIMVRVFWFVSVFHSVSELFRISIWFSFLLRSHVTYSIGSYISFYCNYLIIHDETLSMIFVVYLTCGCCIDCKIFDSYYIQFPVSLRHQLFPSESSVDFISLLWRNPRHSIFLSQSVVLGRPYQKNSKSRGRASHRPYCVSNHVSHVILFSVCWVYDRVCAFQLLYNTHCPWVTAPFKFAPLSGINNWFFL